MAFTLKKCGVKFNPPAIVITYEEGSKTRLRRMPLRNFNKNSGIDRVAKELKSNTRHRKYLEKISHPQLEKLLKIIRDKMNGVSLEESLQKNNDLLKIKPDEDLNKVSEEHLKVKKAVMEESFQANATKPGDADFQYDKEVDFEGAIESCDWDSGESDDEF